MATFMEYCGLFVRRILSLAKYMLLCTHCFIMCKNFIIINSRIQSCSIQEKILPSLPQACRKGSNKKEIKPLLHKHVLLVSHNYITGWCQNA